MNTTKETEFDYEAYTQENAPDPSQIRRGPETHKRRREGFRARLINHVNMEIKQAREMRHVFISYCHENKASVDRLCQDLTSHGVTVWLDRNEIHPGVQWKQAIRRAIHHGDFFIACFSREAIARNQTYMNEELTVAIEELHRRPVDKVWFIPVKLNECEIPNIDIAEGETLQDLQYVNLHKDWEEGIQSLLKVIAIGQGPRDLEHADKNNTDVVTDEDNECVLFRSVEGQHYFIPFQKARWDSTEISLTLTPTSSEQIAFLCALRKGQQDILSFAHQEDAVWVKPQEVSQISTEGETVWEIVLNEDTTGKAFKHRTETVDFKNPTPDQITDMRARRLLLDEKLETASSSLTKATVFDQMLLEAQIRGELSSQYGNRLQALVSPIPELYQHFRKTPERFKKFARLISVLHLKLSNTVEDILQLDVELLSSRELKVKFRGRRSQVDVNKEAALLEFEGICPLPK
jgi:hypothetical protein